MKLTYRTRFIKFFSTFVVILIILFAYTTGLENAVKAKDTDSWLMHPVLVYAMVPLTIAALYFYVRSYYILVKGKGYSAWLTLVVFLGLFGLLILLFLPGKHAQKK